jgi:hypothetical protein
MPLLKINNPFSFGYKIFLFSIFFVFLANVTAIT